MNIPGIQFTNTQKGERLESNEAKMGKVISRQGNTLEILIADKVVKIEARNAGKLAIGDLVRVFFGEEATKTPNSNRELIETMKAKLLEVFSVSLPFSVDENTQKIIDSFPQNDKFQFSKITNELTQLTNRILKETFGEEVKFIAEKTQDSFFTISNTAELKSNLIELALRAKNMGKAWDELPQKIKEEIIKEFIILPLQKELSLSQISQSPDMAQTSEASIPTREKEQLAGISREIAQLTYRVLKETFGEEAKYVADRTKDSFFSISNDAEQKSALLQLTLRAKNMGKAWEELPQKTKEQVVKEFIISPFFKARSLHQNTLSQDTGKIITDFGSPKEGGATILPIQEEKASLDSLKEEKASLISPKEEKVTLKNPATISAPLQKTLTPIAAEALLSQPLKTESSIAFTNMRKSLSITDAIIGKKMEEPAFVKSMDSQKVFNPQSAEKPEISTQQKTSQSMEMMEKTAVKEFVRVIRESLKEILSEPLQLKNYFDWKEKRIDHKPLLPLPIIDSKTSPTIAKLQQETRSTSLADTLGKVLADTAGKASADTLGKVLSDTVGKASADTLSKASLDKSTIPENAKTLLQKLELILATKPELKQTDRMLLENLIRIIKKETGFPQDFLGDTVAKTSLGLPARFLLAIGEETPFWKSFKENLLNVLPPEVAKSPDLSAKASEGITRWVQEALAIVKESAANGEFSATLFQKAIEIFVEKEIKPEISTFFKKEGLPLSTSSGMLPGEKAVASATESVVAGLKAEFLKLGQLLFENNEPISEQPFENPSLLKNDSENNLQELGAKALNKVSEKQIFGVGIETTKIRSDSSVVSEQALKVEEKIVVTEQNTPKTEEILTFSAEQRDIPEVIQNQYERILNIGNNAQYDMIYTGFLDLKEAFFKIDFFHNQKPAGGYDSAEMFRVVIEAETERLGTVLVDTFFVDEKLDIFLYVKPEYGEYLTAHSQNLVRRLKEDGFSIRLFQIKALKEKNQITSQKQKMIAATEKGFTQFA